MAGKNDNMCYEKLLLKFIQEPDPVFSMLEWMANEMMRLESTQRAGAEKGKHNPERTTHFSGTRVRRWDTRLGSIYLLIPKLRKGGYIPFFVTEKTRSEQALINVINEAFVNGVSTRKMERVFRQMGLDSLPPSQVSQMTKELDNQVKEFQNRELEKEYPVVWVDALYEKIRDNGKVHNMAVMVVTGVNLAGKKQHLAIEPMYSESEATYTSLFEKLKERGLEKIHLIVSDAHAGLISAITKNWVGCVWQRCKVHLMRNILAHIPASAKENFAGKLKQIWVQDTLEMAKKVAAMVIEEYQSKYPKAIETLENGMEDSLQYYHFPLLDARKISSNNHQERENREIRRRTRVVGIFPNINAYIRLTVSYMIEYEEDWQTGRAYMCAETLQEQFMTSE